jgi:hypothetical protein
MDRRLQDRELVGLSTACAFVYREIMGTAIELMTVPQLNHVLHDVAHALSNVASVYGAISDTETAKPIPALALLHGRFERGATVLRTPEGIQYRQLSIQRGDMRAGVAILKHVGARFAGSPRRDTPGS